MSSSTTRKSKRIKGRLENDKAKRELRELEMKKLMEARQEKDMKQKESESIYSVEYSSDSDNQIVVRLSRLSDT